MNIRSIIPIINNKFIENRMYSIHNPRGLFSQKGGSE